MPNEALSSLDLFLLQLILTGIDTPYMFRERANLSIGATIPALQRMEEKGLIARQKKEGRNKQRYLLTTKGKRYLSTQLPVLLAEYIERPPTDIESLLRAVALATAQARPESVTAMLDAAVRERNIRRTLIPEPTTVDLRRIEDSYHFFIGRIASAQLEAEASALTRLAKFLSGRTSPKKIIFLQRNKCS
ncbi:MAG TPA: helix-turn-helix transcriptional regulator [Terriglobales bacterium]|nr:helix-turn-helix transcriptional regulator [Terriglobales bacterium]